MMIATTQKDGILSIELDRPHKKNAINSAMYQALADALQHAQADPEVRVILIAGKQNIFTAGHDLEDFINDPPVYPASPVFQFMYQLSHASKPVVAAVCGPAIGIGTTMLLHCDLVYATEDAQFMLPFTRLGLCPEFASSLLFPLVAGYQRAAEKLLLGEAFSATEAYEMGMVSKVLPPEQAFDHAYAQAVKLARLPSSSLQLTKRLMKQKRQADIDSAIVDETKVFSDLLSQPEAQKALRSFVKD